MFRTTFSLIFRSI